MEITTYVFGSDHPEDTIKYADVSFLRRRVKLESSEDQNDQFVIVLGDKYIDDLRRTLFIVIFEEHLLDVFLNPCLKNKKVRNVFMKELNLQPEKFETLLEKNVLQIKSKTFIMKQKKNVFLSKLSFLNLRSETSPVCALIVFCHTQLSLYCLNALKQKKSNIDDIALFSAVCCNASFNLLYVFSNDQIKLF